VVKEDFLHLMSTACAMVVGVEEETRSCQISKCSCQEVMLMYVEGFSSIKFREGLSSCIWDSNAIISKEYDSCVVSAYM
jgi:hypothetical protein